MSKVVEKVLISEEEALELENAWYRYQSMNELILSGVDNDMVFARYEKSYAKYNKLWGELLRKYFKTDYANMSKEYAWSADFQTKEITITKN